MLNAAKDSPERITAADQAVGGSAKPRRDSQRPSDSDRDTGSALRSIYQRAVEEQVPEEMLSLLSKLD